MPEDKVWWIQTLTLRITGEQSYLIAETHRMSIELKVVVRWAVSLRALTGRDSKLPISTHYKNNRTLAHEMLGCKKRNPTQLQ